jgi:sulfide dehydrogenase cytochrome subunit
MHNQALTKILCLLISAGSATSIRAMAEEPERNRPNTPRMAHACGGCHGTLGHSIAPTPAIASKSVEEFVTSMREFKSGERTSSIMNRIAQAYSDDDFVRLAEFFQKQ